MNVYYRVSNGGVCMRAKSLAEAYELAKRLAEKDRVPYEIHEEVEIVRILGIVQIDGSYVAQTPAAEKPAATTN